MLLFLIFYLSFSYINRLCFCKVSFSTYCFMHFAYWFPFLKFFGVSVLFIFYWLAGLYFAFKHILGYFVTFVFFIFVLINDDKTALLNNDINCCIAYPMTYKRMTLILKWPTIFQYHWSLYIFPKFLDAKVVINLRQKDRLTKHFKPKKAK